MPAASKLSRQSAAYSTQPHDVPSTVQSTATVQLFRSARFVMSVAALSDLPAPTLPEVAFAGRSNAGKSSAINVLTGQKRLAFASKTPGRTQLLNFFELSERDQDRQIVPRGMLVDLPGYGFAHAPQTQRSQWDELVGGYVAQRQTLAGIVIVMDARRSLMPGDEALIAFVQPRESSLHLLLTKSDQLNNAEKKAALAAAQQRAAQIGPRATTQLFSALKRQGIDELAYILSGWLRG
jgi:GTP-binding protein